MALSPKSVFITGGNRGIGLGLVKSFAELEKPPSHIFATCRNRQTAKDLLDLAERYKNIHIVQFDVTDYASLPSVVSQVDQLVGAEGLNLLINNAGILDYQMSSLTAVSPEHMRREYETNTIAPVMIVQHFLPLLKRAAAVAADAEMSCSKAAVINIGSRGGSIADNSSGGLYPYRASKSALNIVTKSMSNDLKKEEILVAVLHPGHVQTDLGGPTAGVTVEESVQGLLNVITSLDEKKTGMFYHCNGQQLPW